MKKYTKNIIASGLLLGFMNMTFASELEKNEIKQLVKFLISEKLLVKSKQGKLVPLSYYLGDKKDIEKYFGDYICSKTHTCSVVDHVYESPFAILGKGVNGHESLEKRQAQAQIERTDMQYGANIYDAATWQIALSLAAKHHIMDNDEAKELVSNQLEQVINPENRATDKNFTYGYSLNITNPEQAFTHRMVSTDFFNKDPFVGTKYESGITWDYDINKMSKDDPKKHPPEFFKHVSTWSDWKPIIGENAWAQLIGPLQAEYLLNDGKVDANSRALQNAMNTLKAFSAMQSGVGGFYYAPGGSQGNVGPIETGEISLENNFSMLGGLQILAAVLEKTEQTTKVKAASQKVQIMLHGGITENGFETLGLLSFIYNGAFDKSKGIFYTHGIAKNPKSQNDWKPDTSSSGASMAVDINTWGMSALGVENVDAWYGEGTARTIWKNVRDKGGYFNHGQLWGVGYTLENSQKDKIMSSEWTAGAINVLSSIIQYYESKGEDVYDLQMDLRAMQEGLKNMRNDNYLNANFEDETPTDSFVTLPKEQGLGYLYASKRFAIPFGWNANTLPSTCSNAWVLMNNYKFNPFQYAGSLDGVQYEKPKKMDISNGGNNPPSQKDLPKALTVKFNGGDLKELTGLKLVYFKNGWKEGMVKIDCIGKGIDCEATANLPQGATKIGIQYQNSPGNSRGQFFPTCMVEPATLVCKDSNCDSLNTIVTKYHVDKDNNKPCDLE